MFFYTKEGLEEVAAAFLIGFGGSRSAQQDSPDFSMREEETKVWPTQT